MIQLNNHILCNNRLSPFLIGPHPPILSQVYVIVTAAVSIVRLLQRVFLVFYGATTPVISFLIGPHPSILTQVYSRAAESRESTLRHLDLDLTTYH